MTLSGLDWLIVGGYLVFCLILSALIAKRSDSTTADFFLSGRKLPWWIAGTSMVATTFAADTPLAVTELVAKHGIAGNWLWWNMVFGGILTVFFYARLWRRSGIMTDCEFVAIRYSGRSAQFLRGFRAIYIGIVMNMIVIAWVNLAMVKILKVVFPNLTLWGWHTGSFLGRTIDCHWILVGLLMGFVGIYSSLAGLKSVSVTDAIQFVLAMSGCIVLAVFALRHPAIGGVAGLLKSVPDWAFRFTPSLSASEIPGANPSLGLFKMTVAQFLVYLGIQWWASWYPGSEPGGGGYVAQRMMSTKNEKHALMAALWFNIAHFAIRPWPWIIVAFCSMVMFPELPLADKGQGFIKVMLAVLPTGLTGLLLAAFLAAYMSTIASQTNWGVSYIINDLVRPFIKRDAGERYYVRVSRWTTFVLLAFGWLVTAFLDTISGAWQFVLACSGGIGLVLLLRWLWWRINAWSEIAAMVAPFVIYWPLYQKGLAYEYTLLFIVLWSTVVWLGVTFLTPPTDQKVLKQFYQRIHPGGWGWRPIAQQMPNIKPDSGYGRLAAGWVMGCVLVICSLFFVGCLIFGQYRQAAILFVILAISMIAVGKVISNIDFSDVNGGQKND